MTGGHPDLRQVGMEVIEQLAKIKDPTERVVEVRRTRGALTSLEEALDTIRRATVRELLKTHTTRQVATMLDISFQRVSQISKESK